MLDYIELTNANHFFDGEWLYVKNNDNIYRYLVQSYKNIMRTNRAYILNYHDEYSEYHLAFYDQKMRDLCSLLLKINLVGLKTMQRIIKEFSVDELLTMIKFFDYKSLVKIKGIGTMTCKLIIDTLHQNLYRLKIGPKEEKVIETLTKLGYPRNLVLQNLSQVKENLDAEELLKQLLIMLGSRTDDGL